MAPLAGLDLLNITHVMFDLDGTLISSYMDSSGRDFNAWQVLPGRREAIAELKRWGISISLITNQAGAAFGHVSEDDVTAKLCAVAQQLGFGHLDIYDGGEVVRSYGFPGMPGLLTAHVVYGHPSAAIERYREEPDAIASNRRKPSPGMLFEAMDVHCENAIRSVMVGDRDEDRSAAHNAGVRFVWAEEFFGGQDGR